MLKTKGTYIRDNHFRRTYGISLAQVVAMYNALKGKCPLCQNKMILGGTNGTAVCVDHDHKSGKVRGLLCNHCNQMLGNAYENKETLKNAIFYLSL
jgi:hypothetical protein